MQNNKIKNNYSFSPNTPNQRFTPNNISKKPISTTRPISTFPFSQQQKDLLLKNGFMTHLDLQGIRPSVLAKELKIDHQKALEILQIASTPTIDQTLNYNLNNNNNNNNQNIPSLLTSQQSQKPFKIKGITAAELWEVESKRISIVTFSSSIDQMLGGGIPTGKLTEISGVPGIGKTQFGFQTACSVSIPKILDGAEGECIYIDTEGSFMIKRVRQIAESVVEHITSIVEKNTEDQEKFSEINYTADYILSKIHFYRVNEWAQQLALINVLPSILKDKPNVKLIVLDSVTFHFRYDFEDASIRNRLLQNMAQTLTFLAEKYGIAVLILNQMTTKFSKENSEPSELIPALGDSWAHVCSNRIILFFNNAEGIRQARLIKSPTSKISTVSYHVTSQGIRN